jgi:hypothetical protein
MTMLLSNKSFSLFVFSIYLQIVAAFLKNNRDLISPVNLLTTRKKTHPNFKKIELKKRHEENEEDDGRAGRDESTGASVRLFHSYADLSFKR